MSAIRLQILINGRPACVAGLSDPGVLTTRVSHTHVARREVPAEQFARLYPDVPAGEDFLRCELDVVGTHMQWQGDRPDEGLTWLHQVLRPGDELTIRVLGPGDADPPTAREEDAPS